MSYLCIYGNDATTTTLLPPWWKPHPFACPITRSYFVRYPSHHICSSNELHDPKNVALHGQANLCEIRVHSVRCSFVLTIWQLLYPLCRYESYNVTTTINPKEDKRKITIINTKPLRYQYYADTIGIPNPNPCPNITPEERKRTSSVDVHLY